MDLAIALFDNGAMAALSNDRGLHIPCLSRAKMLGNNSIILLDPA